MRYQGPGCFKFFLFLVFTASVQIAVAQSFSKLAYEGVLTNSAGDPQDLSSAPIRFSIVDAAGCVIYREAKNPGGDTSGNVFHQIGTGTPDYPSVGATLDVSYFVDSKAGESSCTVAASADRFLKVEVAAYGFVATLPMAAVPYSMVAASAKKLGSKTESDLLSVNTSGSNKLSQANLESVFVNYDKLNALLSAKLDSSGNYIGNITGSATSASQVTGLVNVANGGTGLTTVSAGSLLIGNGTGAFQTVNPGTTGNILTSNGTTWVSATLPAAPVLSVAGRTGSVTLSSVDVSDFATATDSRADARITAQKGVANGLATLSASGKVPSTQLAITASDVPVLDANKITTGTFANSMIAGLGIEKLINATAKYFNYKPNGNACSDNEVLKYDSTLNTGDGGWKCASDSAGLNSETDPTVLAFAKNAPSTGLLVNASDQLEVDTGTAPNKIVKLDGSAKLPIVDGSQLTGVLAVSSTNFSGTLSGDVSGGQLTTSVDKIKGKSVAPVAYLDGQVLRYNGTNWVNNNLSMFDLRSTVTGAQAFGGVGCLPNQTLTWTLATDNLSCTNIDLGAGQISSGVFSAARLPAAVGTSGSEASGIVTTVAQSFAGVKTFMSDLIANAGLTVKGKLSAEKAIQIGVDNSATCAAASKGSVRYNDTNNTFEGCNGTSWIVMAQGESARVALGGPSTARVNSAGSASFGVYLMSGVDVSASSNSGLLSKVILNGASSDCTFSADGDGTTVRLVKVTNCTGNGDLSISLQNGAVVSTTGRESAAFGPSPKVVIDNTPPLQPTNLNLGIVPQDEHKTPALTFDPTTDPNDGVVDHYEARLLHSSSELVGWRRFESGDEFDNVNLVFNQSHTIELRAVDTAGNISSVASNSWTVTDWCVGGAPVVGQKCWGGSRYAGTYSSKKYMVTPGGCEDSASPACLGGSDSLMKIWSSGSVDTSADDFYDGKTNTSTIVSVDFANRAAQYCSNLVYGGYSDWFLPASHEFGALFGNRTNRQAVGGFVSDIYYWTSTEANWDQSQAYVVVLYSNSDVFSTNTYPKTSSTFRIRCVRSY